MVKNRAAKEAARKLKAESGITYPRALDLVRTAGKASGYPALTVGLIGGAPVNWRPRPGSRLEITGATGTGKSELMAFMATQAAAAGTEVFILDLDKRGPDYTDITGAVIAADVDAARMLFNDLETAVRPAIIFFEGIPRLAPDMDAAREELAAAAGRLADAGYPVVASWQFPEPLWEGSERILLGRSVARQRTGFFGAEVKQGAGPLEGHFLQAGSREPLLFELCRDGGIPALLSGYCPHFDDLGLPQAVRGFATVAPGLFVFAGPTGSGRTTSMAAVANLITERFARRVAVLESVRELAIRPGRSEITRWDVGDSGSLAKVIDAAVSQVPDIIVIGEVNNGAAVIAAVKAAQAGHTVFMTMHADSAAHAPSRLIDMVSAEGWPEVRAGLSQVLKGVLFQKLLAASATDRATVPAVEFLPMNGIANRMVRDFDDEGLTGRIANMEEGCISLAVSLSQLVLDGHISERTAEKAIKTPMAFRRAFHAGLRHSTPFITLGVQDSGDHVRHDLSRYPHLLVISGDAGRRTSALEDIAAGFPGRLMRVDTAGALADVRQRATEIIALVRGKGAASFQYLPQEIRPERCGVLVDIPHDVLMSGADAAEWRIQLAWLSREAASAGVTLFVGVESESQLELLGPEFHAFFGQLALDGTARYRPFSIADPIRFSPGWEDKPEAA
ncbi:ATPase, T2SS/T4P/T4SS family [Arthrobacter sp. zg-Y1110]|uniref:ATPase, T2SS/T4P/T4SS family n=1 Tax=Arthrobacter sp. zg-Y1110 TaxID=2886932 RepID=UPI001D14B34E|nr:ATPase, T2SS/T4P/T4SS family [Arthrobacter sp. zg-Y1110]MCC3292415.1 Flp pilus assembly complex ATPase component TadA [Arthrobacter sp. zg-Y1110]UWX87149.1 ATPase, T2SS/T4P/T4SS family [Arthrobacter sp. zg-Y1110]